MELKVGDRINNVRFKGGPKYLPEIVWTVDAIDTDTVYLSQEDNRDVYGILIPKEDEYIKLHPKKKDNVNSPEHYIQEGTIECIDYIESFLTTEEYIGYLRGNIAKYLHRFKYKNGIEDVHKAQWYLDRLNEKLKETEAKENLKGLFNES